VTAASSRPQPSARARAVIDADVLLASLSSPLAILDRRGIVVGVNDAWRADGHHDALPPGWSYLDECRRQESRGYDGAREVRQGIEAVLARRMTTFRSEVRRVQEERWYDVIVDALEDESGGVIVTRVDVTERRRAEFRADETRRQLARAGQVAMVNEIASALALEIKQPVTAIRLNALAGTTLLGAPRSTFDGAWGDSREAWQMFKDIYDDASRASMVIEHVHRHVRKHGAIGGIVDLGAACRTTAELVEDEAASRNSSVELELEENLPAIVGAKVEIEQLVMCLTLNALDAAVSSTSERAVVIGTAARGTEVELYVRDTGPGLSPPARQLMFESFFTTKENGLGMGLIIVRSIAERHGGRVSAENGPKGGAIFRVRLPVP
jgi:C4-dicarboxylate-specific signal transduction histidine kinase